mmetsp:Transcript_3184/g.4269  ORF Transcript_3184/g.4269 Transcript_3184/m.4269 type:complete len:188 (-) Transcript_3184:126-689(-)|eukprot:CAMPEP_0184023320 /NCGR_PEP_ID=MMETSP0954-20121128/11296_1 /TAXON_ID=627963 /ORGANISM="Aplanochytrium sp, Strain PBS07" /LENGTH=187 /DNA_ID=CAMNT_0026306193 /DNA_START=211 /DNA_END=774 /DNA_ORIENTATION=-
MSSKRRNPKKKYKEEIETYEDEEEIITVYESCDLSKQLVDLVRTEAGIVVAEVVSSTKEKRKAKECQGASNPRPEKRIDGDTFTAQKELCTASALALSISCDEMMKRIDQLGQQNAFTRIREYSPQALYFETIRFCSAQSKLTRQSLSPDFYTGLKQHLKFVFSINFDKQDTLLKKYVEAATHKLLL